MKAFYDVVVVIPIGPNCNIEFVRDTLDSVIFYTTSTYKIVLADDSQLQTGEALKTEYPLIEVIETDASKGKLGGLYLTLSLAYSYILKTYRCHAILRMDTDALIIGRGYEIAALELFKTQPDIGMAGQYPLDYNGHPWDISWPKEQLRKYLTTYRILRHFRVRISLLKYYLRARSNGYKTGESVFGGVCFVNPEFIYRLSHGNLLPNKVLSKFRLEEDHLFSLLMYAMGFKGGDLSSGSLPFACAWKGLPASPSELDARNKMAIHSVRFWENMTEKDIRVHFKNKRVNNLQQPLTSNTT